MSIKEMEMSRLGCFMCKATDRAKEKGLSVTEKGSSKCTGSFNY